jgi:hypothetical protein
MTAEKDTGLLMVWAEVLADKEADFNRCGAAGAGGPR